MPIGEQWSVVTRRAQDDLSQEVKGTVYWESGFGYRLTGTTTEGSTVTYNVELINDQWYQIRAHQGRYYTNKNGEIPLGGFGSGRVGQTEPAQQQDPDVQIQTLDYKPTVLDQDTVDALLATGMDPQQQPQDASTQINMGGGPMATDPTPIQTVAPAKDEEEERETGGGFKGKAPTIFDGDRTKSKAFISDLDIYFRINRKKADVKNYYSRVLLALSFIKGPKVVNWVTTQVNQLDKDLELCRDDEMDDDLWDGFLERFARTFISTTAKEDAFVRLRALKMKENNLDEYIADHSTLISELGWDKDSEAACQSFREGLPTGLARTILNQKGLPETMGRWIKISQKYHARYAMSKALGYTGGKSKKTWPQKPAYSKKKERDPDAMDVDQISLPTWKQQLFKEGKCFKCKQTGHISTKCPNKYVKGQEATIEEVTEPTKKKGKAKETPPPSYDTIAQQIRACSVEDRERLLETFSTMGDDEPEDF